jgi:acetylornithine/LysW-gamma-L-lysine aminotransferase
MMSDSMTVESQCTSGVYGKRPLVIVKGREAILWDEEGREYIDCVGGQGTANLGHANAAVTEALAAQARRLVSCPELFYNDQRARLLLRLTSLVPTLSRAFLCNSGTEAVEAALKFARYSTGRTEIVAAMRGFHGRTLGALSATWNKSYREPFQPLVPGFHHVTYNNLAALDKAVDGTTAAVILEAVQGEGGVHVGTSEFLEGAQRICRERGALLILDEVQVGVGRTGKMFAFQHHDLQPDMVCMAKSMAGGLPMGATLIGERVRELTPGLHGSTFGGNPLACAAAMAALDVLERDHLADQAAAKGAHFLARLRELRSPEIREIRGLGLIVGVELKHKVAPTLSAMAVRGVLALNAGMNVIRFLPPLVIEAAQLDRVVSALDESLAQPAAEGEEDMAA